MPVDPYAAMEAMGARCSVCPLRRHPDPPVPSETRDGKPVVLAEAPGGSEVEQGRPLVGPGGQEILGAMRAAGLKRTDFGWMNACACRFPKNDPSGFLKKLSATNKRRRDEGKPPIPSPFDCCAPRLAKELAPVEHVLACGYHAYRAVVPGARGSISSVAGTLVPVPALAWAAYGAGGEGGSGDDVDAAANRARRSLGNRDRKVLPSVHPLYVLRRPSARRHFRRAIGRAWAWFRGETEWKPPQMIFRPSLARIVEFLRGPPPGASFWTWDIETTLTPRRRKGTRSKLIRPLEVALRCVAVGTASVVMVIPVMSVDGSRFWTLDEERLIAQELADWYERDVVKIGHNSRWFDDLAMSVWFEGLLGYRPKARRHGDSIMGHRLVAPEERHSLAYVSSFYTDTPAWKEDHTATDTESDDSLWTYAASDIKNTACSAVPIFNEVREKQLASVLALDYKMQDVCAGMTRIGLTVDQAERERWGTQLTAAKILYRRKFWDAVAALGIDPFEWNKREKPGHKRALNPSSDQQIGRLLFGRLELPPPQQLAERDVFTDTGARSVGGKVIRAYLADRTIQGPLREALEALRLYRKQIKLFGTYVHGLRNEPDDDTCWLSADGRVHAAYSAHGTGVGRISGSAPNMLNVPGRDPWNLRTIFVPGEKHVFIDADADQLHLRIISDLWGIPSLQEAFAKGLDPHGLFAGVVFGDRYWNAEGHDEYSRKGMISPAGYPKGAAKNMRAVGKTVRYAGAYGATVETIHAVVMATIAADGSLPYVQTGIEVIEEMVGNWHMREPEWKRAWEHEVELFRRDGYLADPILGRRIYFSDPNDKNQLYNARVLMTEAAIMGEATTELAAAIPVEYAGRGTGICHQNYDSIMVEAPIADGARVKNLMMECMNRRYRGFNVLFSAEAKETTRWG